MSEGTVVNPDCPDCGESTTLLREDHERFVEIFGETRWTPAEYGAAHFEKQYWVCLDCGYRDLAYTIPLNGIAQKRI